MFKLNVSMQVRRLALGLVVLVCLIKVLEVSAAGKNLDRKACAKVGLPHLAGKLFDHQDEAQLERAQKLCNECCVGRQGFKYSYLTSELLQCECTNDTLDRLLRQAAPDSDSDSDSDFDSDSDSDVYTNFNF